MILEGNDEWDPNTTTRRTSVSLRYQLVVNLSAVTVNVNVGRCGFSPAVSILEDSVKKRILHSGSIRLWLMAAQAQYNPVVVSADQVLADFASRTRIPCLSTGSIHGIIVLHRSCSTTRRFKHRPV